MLICTSGSIIKILLIIQILTATVCDYLSNETYFEKISVRGPKPIYSFPTYQSLLIAGVINQSGNINILSPL